jgi:hypothetical protein
MDLQRRNESCNVESVADGIFCWIANHRYFIARLHESSLPNEVSASNLFDLPSHHVHISASVLHRLDTQNKFILNSALSIAHRVDQKRYYIDFILTHGDFVEVFHRKWKATEDFLPVEYAQNERDY